MNKVQILKVMPSESKPCSDNSFVPLADSDSEFEPSDDEDTRKPMSKTEAKKAREPQKALKLAL
jgi:hypothetical protein